MNLELPLVEVDAAELDAHFARIDRELDVLFLDEVEATVERLRVVPPAADGAAA